MSAQFRKFSKHVSIMMGHPWAFVLAVISILLWLCLGPIYHYSDTWQLAVNTSTTIITFLMVFLIQNTQNRDSRALQLKLDELIRANKSARNKLIDLEELSDEDMEKLHQEFCALREEFEARASEIQKHREKKRRNR